MAGLCRRDLACGQAHLMGCSEAIFGALAKRLSRGHFDGGNWIAGVSTSGSGWCVVVVGRGRVES
jgi:hypothetical protein